jgi:proline racemase
MFGVFVTPPSTRDNHAGMIWMDGERFHDMCGHHTVALAMVLVANGLVADGTSTLRLETTAGIVEAEVSSRDGVIAATRLISVPAFLGQSGYSTRTRHCGRDCRRPRLRRQSTPGA